MKRLIALAFYIALGGCGTVTTLMGGNSIASSAPGVSIAAEKSLTIAHLAYNGIGGALVSAAQTGVLHGPNAADARVLYDKAGDALAVADKADAAANEQGVINAVSAATDAISAAQALVKGN